jgi:GAF domain-containing protein
MHHPSLGLPPSDTTAGLPEAAVALRLNRDRLARVALQETIRLSPGFNERYDEQMLRLLLRDYDRHIEQLARALETGEDGYVINYGEWLVPIYRRRRIPMVDFVAMLAGLRDACAAVLSPEQNEVTQQLFVRWGERLKHHGRLPGDHKGNSLIRFFWKGAGVGDDKWI